jgi:NTE family protein
MRPTPAERRSSYDKSVALVLQGGGALGSYQAGVYEALAEADYLPSWIAGISVGAVNAAIIAGNPVEERVARLREFWEEVSAPTAYWPSIPSECWNDALRHAGAVLAVLFGQPGLFAPRIPVAWVSATGPTGLYDTSPLQRTLERLVDFDRINAREVRFSVGAVNVRTGNFCYFDNLQIAIRPEHVMASGALPPGFAAVELDGEYYWDGGLVSNTPLQYVLDATPRASMLAFQVDLFPARGPVPVNLWQVADREKDIRYSSRTRMGTTTYCTEHDLRYNIHSLLAKLPDALRDEPEARFLRGIACPATMDIVQLIYRPDEPQGFWKDIEFARATVEERWAQGLSDTRATIRAAPWLAPRPPGMGVRTFDVLREREARWAPESRPRSPSRSGG